MMDIDSYAGKIEALLGRKGISPKDELKFHTLIAHLHMKGVPAGKAATQLAMAAKAGRF